MYHTESGLNPALHSPALGAAGRSRIGAGVYFLGLTSLLTDISAEMVASILPLYLFTVLRLSPFEFGLIDGLYNGSAAIARLASAYWADRRGRHKALAFIGYLLSALAKFALLFAGIAGFVSVAAVLLADRIGKGIRTSPRDALIASHASADTVGAAFGVHRAMDAVGAIIGPLLATGLLLWLPQRFDIVFLGSLCFAVLGLLVFGLCVQAGREGSLAAPGKREPVSLAAMLRAMRAPRFMLLVTAASLLSLFTLSDNMIYLGLQRQLDFDASYLPLLFVATACIFMCLAIPLGRLADRFGHVRIFLTGYLMLGLVYCLYVALPAGGDLKLVVCIVLLGAYYAATDGILAALAVKQLPAEMHATGIACIGTLTSLGRMGSSILFGWGWENLGQEQAVGWFGIAMLAMLCLTVLAARKLGQGARPA